MGQSISKFHTNTQNYPEVSKMTYEQRSDFYCQSGLFHTSELGELMNYYQWWPRGLAQLSASENGRMMCDDLGINRDYDWVKIGDLATSLSFQQYDDIKHHYLRNNDNHNYGG